MKPLRPEQFQALLIAEKARLERELAAFATRDPRMRDDWDTRYPQPVGLAAPMSHASQDEQADFREEFEADLAQEHILELRLREVNRALERVAAGVFGQCLRCGKPISEERLRANPAAAYDTEHQPRE